MILNSFLTCSSIHGLSSLIPFKTRDASNLITCISFQLHFLYHSLSLLYKSYYLSSYDSSIVAHDTILNLDSLIGYFIYDIFYLLKTSPTSFFILHHIIGIIMIHMIKQFGTPIHLLSQYNLFCFVAEITNPFLNVRHFTKNTHLYRLNMLLILSTYSIFRVIIFPILSVKIYKEVRRESLMYLFSVIYLMSMVWYSKIIKMYRRL
jgi:hypothetical protein